VTREANHRFGRSLQLNFWGSPMVSRVLKRIEKSKCLPVDALIWGHTMIPITHKVGSAVNPVTEAISDLRR
jgi:hypothetical protein